MNTRLALATCLSAAAIAAPTHTLSAGPLLMPTQGTTSLPVDPPDDGEWHEVAPLGKIENHEGVYDAARQVLWMFGGSRKDGGDRNEVWAVDFSGPTPVMREFVVGNPKPAPRHGHTLILDSAG